MGVRIVTHAQGDLLVPGAVSSTSVGVISFYPYSHAWRGQELLATERRRRLREVEGFAQVCTAGEHEEAFKPKESISENHALHSSPTLCPLGAGRFEKTRVFLP